MLRSLFLTAWMVVSCSILSATTLTVNVSCSNGLMVSNLTVTGVADINGEQMTFSTPTDQNGNFEVYDIEDFTEPFFMSYQTPESVVCDGNYISVFSGDRGQVWLNYYPENVPCSCANLELR